MTGLAVDCPIPAASATPTGVLTVEVTRIIQDDDAYAAVIPENVAPVTRADRVSTRTLVAAMIDGKAVKALDCVPARGVEDRAFPVAVGQVRGAAGKASSPGLSVRSATEAAAM